MESEVGIGKVVFSGHESSLADVCFDFLSVYILNHTDYLKTKS